jgi:alkanesulfonate monooxygenase SsuD/methylene tetrahydromethanopterin reductase-like flavin-dependent oxidoreductase (luciferase family)
MHVSMTVPTDDLTEAPTIYAELEALGYDRAFSFEAKHNPFLPLAVAAQHTERIQLGTAIAIAFARTPMTLANAGWDLQTITGGRFALGLGSQVRPHIVERYGMEWSRPAARMREMVLAIRTIWEAWETGGPARLSGRVLPPHPDGPRLRSRPQPVSAHRRSSPPGSDR